MKLKRISIDTSKAVFTLHGIDDQDRPVLRRNLSRPAFEAFFAKLPPTEVALEACGGSHHWGRRLTELGHHVHLIAPQYVKPFVKRGKNDRNDAEAISEAAGRPGMSAVPVKSAERQAGAMVVSVRELLVRQRTQAINALRGHAAEFGVIAAKGTANVAALCERVAQDAQVPEAARRMLAVLAQQVSHLDAEIAALDAQLREAAQADTTARRLMAAPGIGALGAITLALTVDASQFRSGRHFAAWLGLVPKERSTGGRQRLGGISRQGNERLRQLLVVGAMAVIRHARPGSKTASGWLLKLLERRPRKLVAVALANKMARVVWAMMRVGKRIGSSRSRRNLRRGAAGREQLQKMMIGRTDARAMPGFPTAPQAASLFGIRARNPSGPTAMRRHKQAGHMNASETPSSNAQITLDPKEPSTHGNPFMCWVVERLARCWAWSGGAIKSLWASPLHRCWCLAWECGVKGTESPCGSRAEPH